MGNLVITLTRTFQPENLYWDEGSGAPMNGAFWRAVPPSGFYLLGDYAQGDYNPPTGTMVVVQDDNTGGTSAIALTTNFTQIYNDKGSGAYENGAIWMPIAPNGYVALGPVVTRGYDPPASDLGFVCVRFDLVTQGTIGPLIWDDKGSGAHEDVSVYSILPQGGDIAVGTFYAQNNYNPPSGTVYCLPPATVNLPG
jgi:VPS62-like protein